MKKRKFNFIQIRRGSFYAPTGWLDCLCYAVKISVFKYRLNAKAIAGGLLNISFIKGWCGGVWVVVSILESFFFKKL